jgi:histone H3/H4
MQEAIALRDIGRYKKMVQNRIPRAPFLRLMCEKAHHQSISHQEFRFQRRAILALQEAVEAFLVSGFESTLYALIPLLTIFNCSI